MNSAATSTPARASTPAVSLRGLRKEFSGRGSTVTAVDGVDLDIADGEFLTLLGPSGSGKTTVLRIIAGFERPSAGSVALGGVDVTAKPPYERDVNTVFQDYALFPHLSVADNVAYGLAVRKVGKTERDARVSEALTAVQLPDHGDRRPDQLSGGQRQRVALARALVNRPRVLLLDEPLGALDLKLREQMQSELKALQRQVKITFIFVTHDQEEALTMSDRIAVFNAGRIEQVGAPAELYERPATEFVAGFVGTSNLLRGAAAARLLGSAATVSIRPEKITVELLDATAPSASPMPSRHELTGEHRVPGERQVLGNVAAAVYLGSSTRFTVDLDGGGRLLASHHNRDTSASHVASLTGRRVRLTWRTESEFLLT